MPAERFRWQRLLDLALPTLDHVFGPPIKTTTRGQAPDWTLGGGTAVMLHIRHRVSHDIDIFVPETMLKLFTSAANPAAARISGRFQWPGHDLKFGPPEKEIDFLSAPCRRSPASPGATSKGGRPRLRGPRT